MKTNAEHAEFDVVELMPIAGPHEVLSTRQLLGFTQGQLAKELGVTEYTIWRWENNRRQPSEAQTRVLRELTETRIYSKMGQGTNGSDPVEG